MNATFNAAHFNGSNNWANSNVTAAPWKGWYEQGGNKTDMSFNHFQLTFNSGINGAGSDAIGAFTINGTFSPANGAVTFVKQYTGAHSVNYNGTLANGTITGTWEIPGNCSGGFELKQDAIEWKGHYTFNGANTNMAIKLQVQKPAVFGVGQDEQGGFTIRGNYNGTHLQFVKQYHGKHSVQYAGQVSHTPQGSTVTGWWQIPGNCQGQFTLTSSAPLEQAQWTQPANPNGGFPNPGF